MCARTNAFNDKIMVVASAGNTARAFGRVCSENHIPLLLCIPEDNLEAIWADGPWNDCVKLVCCGFRDVIILMRFIFLILYARWSFSTRREGPRTWLVVTGWDDGVVGCGDRSGVSRITISRPWVAERERLPAWEANKRFIADGRFGSHFMKLMVSQNAPFTLMYDAWKAGSRTLLALDENMAREQVKEMCAKVLSNRKPPYSLKGGLYDALVATGGEYVSGNERRDDGG